MAILNPIEQGFPSDRGGQWKKVPSGTALDGVFTFADPSGQKWQLLPNSRFPYYARYCGAYGSGDKTSLIQTALDHAEINTVHIDEAFEITGTLTVPTGKRIEFHKGGKINGTGTLTGGILKAHNRNNIFATTLNVSNVRTDDGAWSAMWHGAVANNSTDDIAALQKAADYVMANTVNIKRYYIPAGTYAISKGLFFGTRSGGVEYDQHTLIIEGNVPCQRQITTADTIFRLTNDSSFVLGIQEHKGTFIRNLGLQATNTINYTQTVAWTPGTTYLQGAQRTNRFSPQACLVFDPFGLGPLEADMYPDFLTYYTNNSNGGSTSCRVESVRVQSAVVGIIMSPSGYTANNESHHFQNIWGANCRELICACNSQERIVKIQNLNCWGNCQTLIDTVTYGAQQGDCPYIDGANIAGNIYQLFRVRGGLGTTNVSIRNIYAEAFYRIGMLQGPLTCTFTSCTFKFGFPATLSGLKHQDWLIETNETMTLFEGCILIWFTGDGSDYPMNFLGTGYEFRACKLNNQIGVFNGSNGSHINSAAQYNNVEFFELTARIYDDSLSCPGANTFPTPSMIPKIGQEITTLNPSSGPAINNAHRTKQLRKCLGQVVKRTLLATNVSITVTGSTATGTIAGLSSITAYNGKLVYTNATYVNTGMSGTTYTGGQIMRLVSIDAAGVISFDRVVTGVVTGTYSLWIEDMPVLSDLRIADISGTSLTNVYGEGGTATVTLTNNTIQYIGGVAPILITASAAGTATIKSSGTTGTRAVLSNYEYLEYGFSDAVPSSNTLFGNGTFFTKGAMYYNTYYATGSSSIIGWLCTQSGVKGSTVQEPAFRTMYSNAIESFGDSFTLSATGSRSITAGETVEEIVISANATMTIDIGNSAAATDIYDDLSLTSGVSKIVPVKIKYDGSGTIHFTVVSGSGTLTINIIKKVV